MEKQVPFIRTFAAKVRRAFNLKKFLLLFCAALLSTWYGLFWSVDHFAILSGGLSFLDMQPALAADSLFAQIRTYDEAATAFYLWWSLFDYAWPFITFTTMLVIGSWLLGFLSAAWQRLFPWLAAAAYLAVLMDWLENIGFATLVIIRPAEPPWLAQLTLTLHSAKLGFLVLFNLGILLILLSVVMAAAKALLHRSNSAGIH